LFTVSLANGKQFSSAPGEKLLDAAGRSGLVLPHSCRSGRCSACKCRPLSGSSTPLSSELGISIQEREDGWILSCVRTATSDLKLDINDLGRFAPYAVKTTPCKIHALEKWSSDFLRVFLRFPPGVELKYFAGQYVELRRSASAKRSYSIANAPREDGIIELHIQRVDGGEFSQYWFESAKVNDLLRLTGPHGTFFVQDVSDLDLIFLATGTGFAPIKAIMESLERLKPEERPRGVWFYWGGRTIDRLYSELPRTTFPVCFMPVLSRAPDSWAGSRGYIQDVVLSNNHDFESAMVFACGGTSMIFGARQALLNAGLSPARFMSDAFVSSGDI